MSISGRAHTISVPWRKVCAALPAVALIGGGIALTGQTAPAGDVLGATLSSHSPVIVVPDSALTMPAVAGPTAPALVLPEGTMPGSSAPVALDSTGIPIRALEAYQRAASLIDPADPACHIDWALLAAIGRVESDHARFGGNQLDSAGVAQPGIIGIPLDGTNSTARITDTDGGRLDRDTVYDRAVGPMQFIPSTWRVAGSDADGDGVKNPQDMADAAAATAIYLCSGPGDLNRPGDLRGAIMRYNASDSYARTVIAIADAYRHGVSALPASDLPAANRAPSTSGAPTRATDPATGPGPGSPAPGQPGSAPTTAPAPHPAVSPRAPAASPPASAAPLPAPALPIPALPIPGLTPTAGTSPPTPLTQEICTISLLGVKTCTIVPPGSTPTPTP